MINKMKPAKHVEIAWICTMVSPL